MGWETRNGRRYYYQKHREHGRAVSRYVPPFIAPFAAATDDLARAEHEQARRAERVERETHARRAGLVLEITRLARVVLAVCLPQLGYHAHKGQWRKKRGQSMSNKLEQIHAVQAIPQADRELLNTLLQRISKAKKPAQEDLIALEGLFIKHPDIWRTLELGNMCTYAVREMLEQMTNNAPATRISLQAGVEGVKRDLGYADAPALEKLLIDAVAVAWLHYYDRQRRYPQIMAAELTIAQATYREKQMHVAQARYLKALETLARVRRMNLPAVQVNIAQIHAPVKEQPGQLVAPDPASTVIVDHAVQETRTHTERTENL
jgi:hypothetical protein